MHKLCTQENQKLQHDSRSRIEMQRNNKLSYCSSRSRIEMQRITPMCTNCAHNELTKVPRSWFAELHTSSKLKLFLSRQIAQIKQTRNRFPMSEECFPNQFLHPNNKSITWPRSTHWILKERKTKYHNTLTSWQCNNKWSTVSPYNTNLPMYILSA